MLTRLEVANYRGFKSYRMDGLAQVNLFVGMNNSGKTALLEGIQFLTSGGNPAVLEATARRRGEMLVVVGQKHLVDVCHCFHGHALTSGVKFALAADNEHRFVTVEAGYESIRESWQSHSGSSERADFALKIVTPEREQSCLISKSGGVDFEAAKSLHQPAFNLAPPVQNFIGPESLDAVDLAAIWDQVTLHRQEDAVTAAMRILEPGLESVHFLTGIFSSGYLPARGGIVVGLKGRETRIPLGSMGDGMRRVLALTISLVCLRGGSLFVDELDAGMHYSVMPDVWRMLIQQALSANTQIFATSHSWDCIEGLSILCQREPQLMSKVAIHKIDRALPHSVAFTGESVVRMVKADIDPR